MSAEGGSEFECAWPNRSFFRMVPISYPKGAAGRVGVPAFRDDTRCPGLYVRLSEEAPRDVPTGLADFARFVADHGRSIVGDAHRCVVLRWPTGRTRGFMRLETSVMELEDIRPTRRRCSCSGFEQAGCSTDRVTRWRYRLASTTGRVLGAGGRPRSRMQWRRPKPRLCSPKPKMLTIRLPSEVRLAVERACERAGRHETGGMLFGEHVGDDEFRVLEATVAGRGTVASFLRGLRDGILRLNAFFARTRRDYQRYNYLGEWHSHPSFALHPSGTDDASMQEIVNDVKTNARFAVSMIVKLRDGRLDASAFVYFPDSLREDGRVEFEEPPA